MSQSRKGQIDAAVVAAAHEVSTSPALQRLIVSALQAHGVPPDQYLLYAAAVTQALGPELKVAAREWIAPVEQRYHHQPRAGTSPRTELARLLGMARQSIDALLAPSP